ncbi:MAG: hypothetical protein HY651_09605 [Acidobacteria bacterium]|nr:hypothetical protein [Acidobacteriota bacterium]
MKRYNITEEEVLETLRKPASALPGHSGRRIAQRMLNGYVLRVI